MIIFNPVWPNFDQGVCKSLAVMYKSSIVLEAQIEFVFFCLTRYTLWSTSSSQLLAMNPLNVRLDYILDTN